MSDKFFLPAIEFIVGLEGGFNSNPHDRGGLTKYGISLRQYPHLDIKNLTKEQAIVIYKKDYWDRSGAWRLNWPLALAVLDGYIQHWDDSVKMLQTALHVKVDGVLGPVTAKHANVAPMLATLADYLALRCCYYATNPQMSLFGRGWFKRLMLVQAKCLLGEPK